jgi:Ca2+-binding RTX toxin-like protein
VWNNGDGTDVVNGDEGRDDVEVNGAPTGDAFDVEPNGDRIKFDRSNLVPFSLDIGSSETMHANGLGGDDTISIGDVGDYAVTAAGGSGDDALSGGPSADTLLGGSGNDKIDAGGGIDVVNGDDGDDEVVVRDGNADVARGGAGTDSVVADAEGIDILDGFEAVDRTQVIAPAPVITPAPAPSVTRAVSIAGGSVKVNRSRRIASLRISCPAASSANCTGSLALLTAKSVKLGGLKVVLQLGSARYSVAAGASVTVKVKLVSGIGRIADRRGHIAVRAVASTGSSGQIASSSKRLTVALSKKGR